MLRHFGQFNQEFIHVCMRKSKKLHTVAAPLLHDAVNTPGTVFVSCFCSVQSEDSSITEGYENILHFCPCTKCSNVYRHFEFLCLICWGNIWIPSQTHNALVCIFVAVSQLLIR